MFFLSLTLREMAQADELAEWALKEWENEKVKQFEAKMC